MGTIKIAAVELEEALKGLGVPVRRDPGGPVDGPTIVVGPPSLSWEAYCATPTSARFTVFVIVPADELAQERLWELVPRVGTHVEQVPDAVVSPVEEAAQPTTFRSSGVELPAYQIQVDVPLPTDGE